jgi:hypothetical protein
MSLDAGLHSSNVPIILLAGVLLINMDLFVDNVGDSLLVLEHLVNQTFVLRTLLNELSELSVRLT